ncbi:DUF6443 domain-containing protein [Chryseobacterium vrystaatense]|uniref:RHS repeat-associated core domain-containing protein n=1 Tax=Chryseobacterium vrystaatense TaxID=307480 RepID=A0A1M5LQ11_9FLAO|nr:DUF6443 domain-containing protein [Chryseobacterium vrystaatense]SHG67141.1 RHS repeat-associated core domain-containing protein [Chryseobacterium vrystaatense]
MTTNNEKIKNQTRMSNEKLKMKKYFSIFTLLFSLTFSAQTSLSTTENYMYTKSCLDADCIKKSESVQYFDGLGRPIQSVAIKATPQGRDVVVPIEYDAQGRQTKSYLPVPQAGTANGAIYSNPLGNASSAGYGSEKIYSEKVYDNIFPGRVSQMLPAGTTWSQKPLTFGYDANTETDHVKKFSTATTWENGATKSIPSNAGIYQNGLLYKNSVTDQDGNRTIEFKNAKGQIVLLRKEAGTTENADTYYVYDEYSQLVFVVPPLLAKIQSWSQADQDNLAYEYRYDGLGRLVEKKIPGKGWEWMVYDKQDRIVGTQDAVMRAKGQWLYTKYDQFGRAAITGLATGGTRSAEQAVVDGYGSNNVNRLNTAFFERQGMDVYYGNPDTTYPNSSKWVALLSLNYYDTYPAYSFNPPFPSAIFGKAIMTDAQNASVNTQAMPTLSLVKNIEDDNWTKSYAYYDTQGRSVGSYTINHLGGYTRTETELDFTGVAQQTKVYHKRLSTDTERVISQSFDYDNQYRVKKHRHQVDSGPVELLAENTYNELSQISNKKVAGGLESIDYQYDIRGALIKVNDPAALGTKLFGYELKYQNPEYNNVAPGKSNGNISEIDWKSASDGILKRYSYIYDPLNRLKDAIYAEPGSTIPHNNTYNEHATYDLNGNIKTLQRNAVPVMGNTATMVDDLVYQYTGNRLDKVIENSMNDTGYEGGNNTIDYDLNGSMINMKDKGIQTINYNIMDLPNNLSITQTIFGQTSTVNLNYLYRADGVKLRKTNFRMGGRGSMPITTVTDYLDGFQYSYTDGGGFQPCLTCKTARAFEEQAYKGIVFPGTETPEWKLDFVSTAEGFYSFTENRYIYQYSDHLGNTRLSFAKNSAGALEILDTNNYYPFGLNHTGGNGLNSSGFGSWYSYKYNGKELQETGMYDYGARFYMPDLGRWGVMDPLAELMRRHSPYNYAFNNPISFTDPDGMRPMNQLKVYDADEGGGAGGGSWTNPNWLGLGGGNLGDSYGFGDVGSGSGNTGTTYETEHGTVYTGSAASDAFSNLMSGNTKPPKQNFWKRAGNYISRLFGWGKKSSIRVEAGPATRIGAADFGTAVEESELTGTQKLSAVRQVWNFTSDNIISKPVEGVQFFGYFLYGLGQVPSEMYEQGRMENIHVKMDMTLRGFRNGTWGKTMEYVDGVTVMSEQEKFEKMSIPAIELTTFGIGTKLNLVKNGAVNAALKMGIKTTAKKTIYKNVKH